MRNYKFRYFNKVDGKMEDFDGMPMFVGDLEYINEDGNLKVMQYTGLKDKNGVEIYENDIVRIQGAGTVYMRTIVFEQGTFHFGYIPDGMCDYREMEVVGNIHQHSELLEAKK